MKHRRTNTELPLVQVYWYWISWSRNQLQRRNRPYRSLLWQGSLRWRRNRGQAKRQAARFPDTDCYSSVPLDCDRGSLSAMTSYILKYAWNATSAIVKCVSTEKWEEKNRRQAHIAIDIFISPIIYDWYFITSVLLSQSYLSSQQTSSFAK